MPDYLWLLMLALVLVACLLAGLSHGSVAIPPSEQCLILLSRLHLVQSPTDSGNAFILLQIRMPRVLLGALVGFALALCGAIMQGLFRNPLADPYLLGIAGGATAGAAAITALGLLTIPLALSGGAFLGAVIAVAIVYGISRTRLGQVSNYTLILAGVAIAALFSSLTTFLIFISADQQLRHIVFWIMGSLAAASWSAVASLAVVISVAGVLAFLGAGGLNAMALGEDMARHLGLDPQRLKKGLLGLTTLLTAAAVCVSGTIGFVGLIVPHAMRLILGPDHRLLLPASALAGASFLVFCDTLARTLASPTEIPVGIITSIFGAPFFLYLLRFHKKIRQNEIG